MNKFLLACTLAALSTGLVTACGDDEGDDDSPAAGKGGSSGASGSANAGKGGSSAGTAGTATGGKGGAGTGGTSAGGTGGKGGDGGKGSGGKATGGTDAGGEGGLGGEAGFGGAQGGEAGSGGGEGGASGQGGGGEGGVPEPAGGQGGQGGEAGAPAPGQAGQGGEGGSAQEPTATLRLNEINPNIGGGQDLIELLVVGAGNIEGIVIQQSVGTTTTLATLPSLTVAVNDLVVVHLNPVGAIQNETISKNGCTAPACFDAAWDVRGGTPANGLAQANRVISVLSGSTLQDGVPFVVDGGSAGAFPALLQALQAGGHWFPTSCGGDDCTYSSDPTALEVSVNWTDTETTVGGDSVQVTAANNNQASSWEIGPSTFGEPND